MALEVLLWPDVVVASNVLLLGVLYLQESSLISQHVHQQGQSSAKDVQLAGFLTFSTTTEAAKLVLSTAAVAVLTAAANAKFIGPSAPSHAPRGVSETRAVKWSRRGASLRILARLLPLTKMDHRGAGCSIKRAVGDFMRPSCRLARGALRSSVSGTLFLQVGLARMQPVGALIC